MTAAHHVVRLVRPDARRASAAERQRRARQRRKQGLVVLHLEVEEGRLAEALRARGMPDEEILRRSLVERELSEVIELWIERWLRLGRNA